MKDTCCAKAGFDDKSKSVDWAWMMLARRAEPKSKEKWCIDFVVVDLAISSMSQLIISSSTKIGITFSLTEHFCNKAKQNLWITEPFYYFFTI